MRKILFVAVLCLTAFCGIANAGRYYDQTVISTSTTKATKYFSGDIYVYPNLSSYATSYSLENGSITLTGTVDGIDLSALNTSITTTYLTVSSATATYLQLSSATATYFPKAGTGLFAGNGSITDFSIDSTSATFSDSVYFNGVTYLNNTTIVDPSQTLKLSSMDSNTGGTSITISTMVYIKSNNTDTDFSIDSTSATFYDTIYTGDISLNNGGSAGDLVSPENLTLQAGSGGQNKALRFYTKQIKRFDIYDGTTTLCNDGTNADFTISSSSATFYDPVYLGFPILTEAELAVLTPITTGQIYYNSTAQTIALSTGTSAGDFVMLVASAVAAGDMLKAIYDTDGDSIVDNSEQLNSQSYIHYVNTATYQTVGGSKTWSDYQTFASSVTFSSHTAISGVLKINEQIRFATGKSIQFENPSGETDSAFIYSNLDEKISLATGGTDSLIVTSSGIAISPTKKIYVDGGGDSYIQETSSNYIGVFSGGEQVLNIGSGLFETLKSLYPGISNSLNLGDASQYWANIHYKTLVAHSLKAIPDSEQAIEKIKLIDIEKKDTYPKSVYVPAPVAEADILDGEVIKYKKGDKMGADGTDVNQLLVYLIESIKLLDAKNKQLEQRVLALEEKVK